MIFYLVTISLTWLCSQHRDAKKVQNWLFYKAYEKGTDDEMKEVWVTKNVFLKDLYLLITCPYCMGFYVGVIVQAIIVPPNTFYVMGKAVVEAGFVNAILSMAVCTVLNYFDR